MTIEALKARLREDLKAALLARDGATVSLLRALAAALDNAEALPTAAREESDALRLEASGPSEAARRELTAADIAQLLDRERDERLAAAEEYTAHGRPDDAARLRGEAEHIERYRRAC